MRKTLTLALLTLVLLSLVTATWAGVAAVVLSEPVELLWLAESQPVELASPDFVPLTRPTAAALLRGPPSSGLHRPRTTRTLNQETACRRSADLQRSSPT